MFVAYELGTLTGLKIARLEGGIWGQLSYKCSDVIKTFSRPRWRP